MSNPLVIYHCYNCNNTFLMGNNQVFKCIFCKSEFILFEQCNTANEAWQALIDNVKKPEIIEQGIFDQMQNIIKQMIQDIDELGNI